MSDLFESLSARFDPATQPVIRPRPQSRFEGANGNDNITEEDSLAAVRPSERPAPTPPKPSLAPSENVQDAKPPNTRRSDSAQSAAPVPKQAKPETPPKVDRRTDTTISTEQQNADVSPQNAPARAAQNTLTEPEPRRAPAIPPRADAPSAPAALEVFQEIRSDSAEEPANKTRGLIETRIAQTPPEALQPQPQPEAAQSGYTIRIGRIEMRQPAPPAPPPAPPPPRRAAATAPGAMNGGVRGGSGGSGLTDYLGWKRR